MSSRISIVSKAISYYLTNRSHKSKMYEVFMFDEMISTKKNGFVLKRNFATGGLCFMVTRSDERKDHHPNISVNKTTYSFI